MFALFSTYFGDSGVNGSDKLVGLAEGKKKTITEYLNTP